MRASLRGRSNLVRKRRKQRLLRLSIGIVAFFLLVGGLAWLSRHPAITISRINVRGTTVVDPTQVEMWAREALSGNYLFLLPRRNVALFSREKLESSVLAAFPRVARADVSTENLKTITITLEERKPFGLWCGEKRPREVQYESGCYFLDESGFIFAEAPDFSGDVFFRYYGALSHEIPIGTRFLPEETFRNVSSFLLLLADLSIKPYAFSILDEHDFELTLLGNTAVLFRRDSDFTDVFERLQAVLTSDDFKKRDLADFDYLDLRFGNKVYYK